jgi:predicted transcriptional regulator
MTRNSNRTVHFLKLGLKFHIAIFLNLMKICELLQLHSYSPSFKFKCQKFKISEAKNQQLDGS